MLALRVPCDAQMNRRDVNSLTLGQHIPRSPANSVLLGEPGRGLKVNPHIYRHSAMPLAGIHSLYYFWIPACAGMTEE